MQHGEEQQADEREHSQNRKDRGTPLRGAGSTDVNGWKHDGESA
jgi:hypothetical protein